jgi:cell division protein ZapA
MREEDVLSESKSIQIEIYGQRYTIKGQASESYVRELASYLDQKMQHVAKASKVNTLPKIAILAALNITDELFKQRRTLQHKDGVLKKAERRVSDLIDTLEGQFEDLKIE